MLEGGGNRTPIVGQIAEDGKQFSRLHRQLRTLVASGHQIVIHIHDEIVDDEPTDGTSVEDIVALMTRLPTWADGLPLDADSYKSSFYMKD